MDRRSSKWITPEKRGVSFGTIDLEFKSRLKTLDMRIGYN